MVHIHSRRTFGGRRFGFTTSVHVWRGLDRWHSVPGVAATLHFSRRSVLAHLVIYKGFFGCGMSFQVVRCVAVRRGARDTVDERTYARSQGGGQSGCTRTMMPGAYGAVSPRAIRYQVTSVGPETWRRPSEGWGVHTGAGVCASRSGLIGRTKTMAAPPF